MRRPHRQAPGVELDPELDQEQAYRDERVAMRSYQDGIPSRGRSPGPRRRYQSEPVAASATGVGRDRQQQETREPRKHVKNRKAYGASVDAPDRFDYKFDRRSGREGYYDELRRSRHDRSRGLSADAPYATKESNVHFDAFAPASHRGRERQHAYHPPKTSETRRPRYPDYEGGPRPIHTAHARYAGSDDHYRGAESGRSRRPVYGTGPRRGSRQRDDEGVGPRGESDSSRISGFDHENHRSKPRSLDSRGGDRRNQERPDRGRSLPRNGASAAPVGVGGRPRARSAANYAALGEAAQTAFRVGSQAALQMRNEPGPWIGEKGTRVATAALGAALVDTFVGHKASNMKGGMRHQALRQACEMGIRNFVMQPAVNTANHRNRSGDGGDGGGGGLGGSGRRKR
ncbi:hypothetical protein CTRI78_v012186 [Colletotrichum trifolii]|uniref:Uncharacterized protein n=1 Tax=Colletotrichum trifolii TaxID=5466 RepID=A0A4R8PYA1_COLTR|nr:hypothetical protein CTRI78_v012186 [Colletotrichum trifolii]